MLSPTALYPLVVAWLQALDVCPHPVALAALAHLVTALLHAQSLKPSALMRALLSPTETPVPACQRDERVARALDRPWLTSAWLTPLLVRAVLTLLPPEESAGEGGTDKKEVTVALDSVRCGPWEAFTLGIVWRGRVVPVAWRVLAYPWPKGQVTPAVCALVAQAAAAWPAGEARTAHLVADRAFPGKRLFGALRRVGWGWTIRLSAPLPVTVGEERLTVRDLMRRARPGGWMAWAGAYGHGRTALPATLVVGRGLSVLPAHQRMAGSLRHRSARRAERDRVVGYRSKTVTETDPWMALCTTHTTWQAAVRTYRRRWATEGSDRDAQGGGDGQHGWDLEGVLAEAVDAGRAERLRGLWALGVLLQTFIGAEVQHGPAEVRAIAAEWTTTGRLSVWAHGQFALREPSGRLHAWLERTVRAGAARVAAAPRPPATAPPMALPLRKEGLGGQRRAA